MPTKFSVLISTYFRERAANLQESLESIFAQTMQPMEVVLVVDGNVDGEQETVIDRYAEDGRGIPLRILRLSFCRGLANALNAGLEMCRGEFVVRMDSDDRARPNRIEELYRAQKRHPEADLFCSSQAEFDDETGEVIAIREIPLSHEEIVRRLKWRNVISHPTVMFRRSALVKIGGYRGRSDLTGLEDYDLFVRLALSGARFQPITKILLDFRTSDAQRRRRGGLQQALWQLALHREYYKMGFLRSHEWLVVSLTMPAFRLTPYWLKQKLYRFVRRRPEASDVTVHNRALG
jgi:glycosyltransferase involved in cell wall biosynthesis